MQVFFARYDPVTLEVLSYGKMEERHIDMLKARGEYYIKISGSIFPGYNYRVNLENNTVESYTINPDFNDILNELKNGIIVQLRETDYTQAIDSSDHLTLKQQSDWRNYRKAIRDAQNQETLDAAVKILPLTDPKGEDRFKKYRDFVNQMKPFDQIVANTA